MPTLPELALILLTGACLAYGVALTFQVLVIEGGLGL